MSGSSSYLRDTHGLDVKLRRRGARQVAVLQFTTAASAKFQELVAPYVHPSMDYKLLPRFRGQFAVEPQFVAAEHAAGARAGPGHPRQAAARAR